jgi:hypothetical protein
MSVDIDLSAGVRSNLLPLQHTASVTTQAQQRFSTGKRVNSAIDDPTSFFTAASLNNRAGDLSSLLDSIGEPLGRGLTALPFSFNPGETVSVSEQNDRRLIRGRVRWVSRSN